MYISICVYICICNIYAHVCALKYRQLSFGSTQLTPTNINTLMTLKAEKEPYSHAGNVAAAMTTAMITHSKVTTPHTIPRIHRMKSPKHANTPITERYLAQTQQQR